MLNSAIAEDLETSLELKELYKAVVTALVTAIEVGGGEEPPVSVSYFFRGRLYRWRLVEGEDTSCESCCCDLLRYEPDGVGAVFDFCPFCWSAKGEDRERRGSFHVGQGYAKRERDLPPGMSMSMRFGEQELPLVSRAEPASEAEREEKMRTYRESARASLEIGRQVWMARMAVQGMNDVPQDYGEARTWFEKAARWGHGEAISTLGLMALHGLGEPVDYDRAVDLCHQAADRGYAPAETGMGRLYWDGKAVREDCVAAAAWWRRAAARKDREGQLWLGNALIRGIGVERDAKQGLALVREAAEAGYVDAQAYLGKALEQGLAGPRDEAEAVVWLKKAAKQGHVGAEAQLEKLGESTGESTGE